MGVIKVTGRPDAVAVKAAATGALGGRGVLGSMS